MAVYKHVMTHATIISGSPKMNEEPLDVAYEVDCAWPENSTSRALSNIDPAKKGLWRSTWADEELFMQRFNYYREDCGRHMLNKGASVEEMRRTQDAALKYVQQNIFPRLGKWTFFLAPEDEAAWYYIPVSLRPDGKTPYMVVWKNSGEKVE